MSSDHFHQQQPLAARLSVGVVRNHDGRGILPGDETFPKLRVSVIILAPFERPEVDTTRAVKRRKWVANFLEILTRLDHPAVRRRIERVADALINDVAEFVMLKVFFHPRGGFE